MLAVIEEAVSDYQRHVVAAPRAAKRLFREAHAWIMSDDTAWSFSFVNLCDALGLDPGALRAGLRRWGDRQRERTRLASRWYAFSCGTWPASAARPPVAPRAGGGARAGSGT